MVDRVALDLRARRLEDELARLERARGLGRDEYLGDRDAQILVERALEIAIQACIDIGAHLVAALGYGVPDDYADVFSRLSERGGLDRELAERLKQASRQRNLLVHVYLEIDHAKIWDKLSEVDDLRAFACWAVEVAAR